MSCTLHPTPYPCTLLQVSCISGCLNPTAHPCTLPQVSCISGCRCCLLPSGSTPPPAQQESCVIDAAAPAGQSASLQQLAQLTISQHTECVVRLRTLPAEGAGGVPSSSW